MSDQTGFDGGLLFAQHETFGADIGNLPELALLAAPTTWLVTDLSLVDGPLIYSVDVSNSLLHYTVLFGGQDPLVFGNADVFADEFGTIPPILGASVLDTSYPFPTQIHVDTTDNEVRVFYPGQGFGFSEVVIDIQVSFTNPVANADSFAVPSNNLIAGNVLSNDVDLDGNLLEASLDTNPLHGTLILDRTGIFIYTPDQNYVGPDSFTYSVSDGVASSSATVNLNVFAHAVGGFFFLRTGDTHVDSLLSATKWYGDITFSFPQSGNDYSNPYSRGEPTNNFAPVSFQQQEAVRAILTGETSSSSPNAMTATSLSSFTTAVVQEVNGLGNGLNGLGDIRVGQSSISPPHGYFPLNQSTPTPSDGSGGDVWLLDFQRNAVLGTIAYYQHIHELGHALGLEHPFGGLVQMPTGQDAIEFTVMSYNDYPGENNAAEGHLSASSFPQTFMMYDIAALQFMYGANYGAASNNTDTVYTWNPTTGETFINSVSQGTPNSNTVFLTIWDGGGIDTYDMSNYSNGVTIDLTPGSWSITSDAQRAGLGNGHIANGTVYNALLFNGNPSSLIENAIGGSGNDHLTGNQADNVLTGNDGDDTLYGGAGNDQLNGGGGSDTAVYTGNLANYSVTPNADGSLTIADMRAGSPDGTDTLTSVENVQFADQRLITGIVVFIASPSPETFLGLNGDGTVSYALAHAGVTASLSDPASNTGDAAGDSYISIENLIGSAFNDTLIGDGNANVLEGGPSADKLVGGGGIDTASYADATSGVTASLSKPSDNKGEAAGDTYNSIENLLGSHFNDTLIGNPSANILIGGDGNDTLKGVDGNDTLIGGLGADTLNGGAGHDVFAYQSPNEGGDTILEFSVKDDQLQFSALGFGGGLIAGQNLVAGMTFIANKAPTAPTSAGTFLYDTHDYNLFWDADGSGAGAPVLIAHFDGPVALKADNLSIISESASTTTAENTVSDPHTDLTMLFHPDPFWG